MTTQQLMALRHTQLDQDWMSYADEIGCDIGEWADAFTARLQSAGKVGQMALRLALLALAELAARNVDRHLEDVET